MTHFAVLVLTDPGLDKEKREEQVSNLLAPFDENNEMFRDNSRWDWWEIGGRYTGFLSQFDPRTDPQNYEDCFICGGTGTRSDFDYEGPNGDWARQPTKAGHPVIGKGCNACYGTGKTQKWDLVAPEGANECKVSDLKLEEALPIVVTPDGKWNERTRFGWWGAEIDNEKGEPPKSKEEWQVEFDDILSKYQNHIAVLVDCHV